MIYMFFNLPDILVNQPEHFNELKTSFTYNIIIFIATRYWDFSTFIYNDYNTNGTF